MNMSSGKNAFAAVVRREWRRMTSRRLYFGVCIVLPLFCLFFMSTIFGTGQMVNIPVGIVDQDQSATSREIIRTVEAVPTLQVTQTFADPLSARKATQQKEIYGYLVIPPDFEAKVVNGNNATLSYYYHYALLSVGTEVKGAFESVLQELSMGTVVSAAEASGISETQIETFLLPVNIQSHPLYNPDLNYSVYLCLPFFFILFQIIVLLVTTYVIGIEIKFKTASEWFGCARLNPVVAVAGKMAPYTLIFIIMGVLANFVLFHVLHLPYEGVFVPMMLASTVFILATEALGLFLVALFPAISIVISVVSMTGSLGATLSGVTFPAPFFFPAIYYLSFLFPVRHFVEIMQSLLYGNAGFAVYWPHVSVLLLFLLLPLPILPHLKKSILSHKYEDIQ